MLGYFFTVHTGLLEALLVAWQPQSDDNTPVYFLKCLFIFYSTIHYFLVNKGSQFVYVPRIVLYLSILDTFLSQNLFCFGVYVVCI